MKRFYLICNAHIDPVWQWQWEEGAGVAVTTFSAAADFLEDPEFEGFIFNHNEALLYQWVEEYAPDLFIRIQKLVKRGKWHIMGGWFLQPDCNMPSGESIARQILEGRRYFREKFGVEPVDAVNFDSFGHSRGLVQILADCGYRGYVCCRPPKELIHRDFIWKGFNGSEILLHRAVDGYNTWMGHARERIEPLLEYFAPCEYAMFLWGVGNHGGGPSRKDLRELNALMRAYPQIKIRHAALSEYFDELEAHRSSLPSFEEGLNPVLQGCYTSQIRIKQQHMRLENELFAAEKMCSHAAALGMEYPERELKAAQRDLLFSEFHDVLPGTCVAAAEEVALEQLNHGVTELSKVRLRAFFRLAAGARKAAEGEYPLFAYNPHPTRVRVTIEAEFMLADQNHSLTMHWVPKVIEADSGKEIPSQTEKEDSNIPIDWRKKVVFEAELKPFSMQRYSIFTELKAVAEKKKTQAPREIVLEGRNCRAVIDCSTGLLRMFEVDGEPVLKERSCEAEIFQASCDPWGFRYNETNHKIGVFRLMTPKESAAFAGLAVSELSPVRIVESGPVRKIVEAFFTYNKSALVVRYRMDRHGRDLELRLRLYNQEKDKAIKLAFHTFMQGGKYYGKTCYGVNDLSTDDTETVAQDWVMLTDGDRAFSLINFGNYGSQCDGSSVRTSLVQSAAYTGHPFEDREILPDDRYTPRIDQGERAFRFVLCSSDAETRWENVENESMVLHQPPVLMNFFPTGTGKSEEKEFLRLTNPRIVLTCCKRAEDGDGIILRLFNGGRKTEKAEIISEMFGISAQIQLRPSEFQSFRMRDKSLLKTNILEESFGENHDKNI